MTRRISTPLLAALLLLPVPDALGQGAKGIPKHLRLKGDPTRKLKLAKTLHCTIQIADGKISNVVLHFFQAGGRSDIIELTIAHTG